MKTSLRLLLLSCLVLSLAACGSSKKGKLDEADRPEKRISVMQDAKKPKIDPSMADYRIELPEPAANRDWAQQDGGADHAAFNAALENDEPKEAWAESIGSGSNKSFRLIGHPVISGSALYTLDSTGRASAFNLADGERYWRVDTTPASRDGAAMGGGIAIEGNVLYVTTGFGEVLALRPADGGVLWRTMIGKPIRSAPTVIGGRVLVVTIENETQALDARTGRVVWHHSGIAESAALMGSSPPAAKDDTVVVAYSSGEMFALRTQNGRVVWSEVLAVPTQKGALPAIADIRGAPVIEKGRVFAISHSGRMESIDLRSGERVWEADIGGRNTPCVAGNAVFVVTNDNELIALSRDTGRIVWITELRKTEDPDKPTSRPVVWSGPVLAEGKLWLTNSLGYIASFDAKTGELAYEREVAEPFFVPPVVAGRMMILLSDDGRLRGFR